MRATANQTGRLSAGCPRQPSFCNWGSRSINHCKAGVEQNKIHNINQHIHGHIRPCHGQPVMQCTRHIPPCHGQPVMQCTRHIPPCHGPPTVQCSHHIPPCNVLLLSSVWLASLQCAQPTQVTVAHAAFAPLAVQSACCLSHHAPHTSRGPLLALTARNDSARSMQDRAWYTAAGRWGGEAAHDDVGGANTLRMG
jgi:hypothetical protein